MLPDVFSRTNFSNPRQFTPADVLQYLLDGTGGVYFFSYSLFDARTFWAIGEVSRMVANNEKLFIRRTNAKSNWEITGIEKDYVRIWQDNGEILLVLLNPTKKTLKYKIKSPVSRDFSGILKPGEIKSIKIKR